MLMIQNSSVNAAQSCSLIIALINACFVCFVNHNMNCDHCNSPCAPRSSREVASKRRTFTGHHESVRKFKQVFILILTIQILILINQSMFTVDFFYLHNLFI